MTPNMPVIKGPAERAAEAIADLCNAKPLHQITKSEIASTIRGEYATERREMVEAAKEMVEAANAVLGWYAVWQRDPDKSPNTAKVFFDQLRAAIERGKK